MNDIVQVKATDASPEQRELPSGWRWVLLGEVCDINPRRSDITRRDIESTSFVPMEAVDAARGVIYKIRERPFADVKKGYTYFEDGDVLFAKITPCMQNGKHAIARSLIEGIGFASTEFHVIRPVKGILADWIHHFVRQPAVLHDATNHFTGAVGQQRVPDDFLKSLEIPLPPIEEQRRITGVLREQMAAVEKAHTAAQARLEAVKALPAAFLRQVFPQPGQPLPNGWRWVKLGEVTSVVNGTTPDSENSCFWNGDIVWITPTDLGKLAEQYIRNSDRRITKAGFDSRNLTRVPPRSIVLSSRAPIGHLGIAAVELCTNQGCKSFIPNEDVDEWFLYYSLKRSVWKLQQLGSGATFAEISKTQLENFIIPIPPIEEQRLIAGVLSKQMAAAEKARTAAEAELNTISALPAALLRRAFNGEL